MKIPKDMIEGIQGKLMAVQMTQRELSSYVEGCLQGLGLKGEWNLNTVTWSFEKAKEMKK